MKTEIAFLFGFGVVSAFSSAVFAQGLELPRPSPGAKVVQTVGLTDITVEYSSPGVKGRPIWGKLVPYDEPWRAGANSATKVTFSKDVIIGDTAVPAGSYGFFIIPSKTTWTAIFNKSTNLWGTNEYNKELDLLRLQVKPQAVPSRERLAYFISDFTDSAASLVLEWEKVRVAVPIK